MRMVLSLVACLAAMPAFAKHPGDRLDEVTAQREPAFREVSLNDVPALDLFGPDGAPLALDSLSDQVIVLSFMPSGCGAPCADQQALLAKVTAGVNASPMVNMVTFLVVTDADNPVPQPVAGNVVIARPNAPIGVLIARYRALAPDAGDMLLVHVIARGGRHAGIFLGSAFRPISVILYVNGLTNEHRRKGKPPE